MNAWECLPISLSYNIGISYVFLKYLITTSIKFNQEDPNKSTLDIVSQMSNDSMTKIGSELPRRFSFLLKSLSGNKKSILL